MREEVAAVTTAAGDLVRRYADAGARDDFDTMEALRHDEWQEAWPQSGEIVISSANYRVTRTQRPEGRTAGRTGAARRLGRLLVGRGHRPLCGRLALAGRQRLRAARRTRLARADLLRAARHSSRLAGAMGRAGGAGRHVDPPTSAGRHGRRRAGRAARPRPWAGGSTPTRSRHRGNVPRAIATRPVSWVQSVTERAPCPAGAYEVKPCRPVREFDDRAAKPSWAPHDDSCSGGIEDRNEVSLNVRIETGRRRQR